MANEFIIKNGYFSQGNSTITGSLTITSSGTDTLRILKGASDVVQQGSSVYLLGGSGSSYTQLQQGVGRFTIWGYDGVGWGEKFTINSTTGNTGIGTSTPFTKLTVNGSVSVTGTANSNTGSFYIDHQGVQSWKIGVTASNTSTLSIGNDVGGAFANKILNITNAGNVGIGTITPNAKLDVNGNAIITGSLTVTNGITGSGLQITGSTTTDLVRITQTGTGNAFVVEDSTNPDSTPFVITNTGSVGIGTTSPLTPLHVYVTSSLGASGVDGIRISDNQTLSTAINLGVNTPGTYTWMQSAQGGVGPKNLILNPAGGNVAIGTTSSIGKLDINTGLSGLSFDIANQSSGTISFGNVSSGTAMPSIIAKSSNNTGLYILAATPDVPTNGIDMVFDVRETDGTDFATLTTSAFRFSRLGTALVDIERNGNVGIGTTTPTTKLHVSGSENANWVSIIENGSPGGHKLYSGYNNGTSRTGLFITGGGNDINSFDLRVGTSKFAVLGDGNIGIGTISPYKLLTVSEGAGGTVVGQSEILRIAGTSQSVGNKNEIGFANYADNYNASITLGSEITSISNYLVQDFYIATRASSTDIAATERMRITSNGAVGIGTATPTQKLSVATGSVTADEYYFNNVPNAIVARRVVGGVVGVNSVSYTTICNVVGNSYSSGVRISLGGVGSGNVVSVIADILTNHYTDIYIESKSGIYTLLTLKVISDLNENFTIQAITSAGVTPIQLNVEVFPLSSETITFNPASIYTGTTLIHPCVPGLNISATGGTTAENGNLSVLGNVGIGTTTPATKLHVSGSENANWVTTIENGSIGGHKLYSGYNNGTTRIGLFITGGGNNLNSFDLRVGTSKFVVLGDGNVGIGTATPSTTLDVNGEIRLGDNSFNSTLNQAGIARITSTFTDQSNVQFYGHTGGAGNNPVMILRGAGNVGIGTTTPNAKLDVNGNANVSGSLNNGVRSVSSGLYSHAEGFNTTSSGNYSHAEGGNTFATSSYSHAEGYYTLATDVASHAEGYYTTASGFASHAEGQNTTASGFASHTEGLSTQTIGSYSHAEGFDTVARGNYSHGEGSATVASASYSHTEGSGSITRGSYSHAEGWGTIALGQASHAEGINTTSTGSYSHAEGASTITRGLYSHAEGNLTVASGSYSHAEGVQTTADGIAAHAEGSNTDASADYSHAEGFLTIALGTGAHSEGRSTIASGTGSHAEGYYTTSSGDYSHAEGNYTVASGSYQHVQGQFNIASSIQSAFIVGNGTSISARSNLIFAAGTTVQITGSLAISGSVVAQSGNTITSDALVQASLLYLSNNF